MEYKLPEQLGQIVISYLAKQPYDQVAGMISALQGLEKIDTGVATPPLVPVSTETAEPVVETPVVEPTA